MEQALLALGFDARGVTVDERLLDPVLLRSWIRKLRGICTHPQVGQLQNSAEKKGTFKSIEEVLDVSHLPLLSLCTYGNNLGAEHAREQLEILHGRATKQGRCHILRGWVELITGDWPRSITSLSTRNFSRGIKGTSRATNAPWRPYSQRRSKPPRSSKTSARRWKNSFYNRQSLTPRNRTILVATMLRGKERRGSPPLTLGKTTMPGSGVVSRTGCEKPNSSCTRLRS